MTNSQMLLQNNYSFQEQMLRPWSTSLITKVPTKTNLELQKYYLSEITNSWTDFFFLLVDLQITFSTEFSELETIFQPFNGTLTQQNNVWWGRFSDTSAYNPANLGLNFFDLSLFFASFRFLLYSVANYLQRHKFLQKICFRNWKGNEAGIDWLT